MASLAAATSHDIYALAPSNSVDFIVVRCFRLQISEAMYGQAMGGVFGYSHLAGGYQGGQADYVRVPFGESRMQ